MDSHEYRIYLVRAEQFPAKLENDFFGELRTLTTEYFPSPNRLSGRKEQNGKYRPIKEMEVWGKLWDSAHFHLSGEIPQKWQGESIYLKLEMGGEILVFDSLGVPYCGLSNTCVQIENFRKNMLEVTSQFMCGNRIDFHAEVGANGLNGWGESQPEALQKCEVGFCRYLKYGIFNKAVWDMYNDYKVVLSLLQIYINPAELWNLPVRDVGGCSGNPRVMLNPDAFYNTRRARQLCAALNQAIDLYADEPRNAEKARQPLLAQLAMPAEQSSLRTVAVGHGHLDIGYLWPYEETIRKATRTFASQIHNLEHYPTYVFGASQPQLYQWVKEYQPELFAKVKKYVKAGRWDLEGGMWVEADCNLISGESMVRQFVHGKNFFMDEFGIEVKNLWLPDVFGYSAAMPQIMKKAGVDYFTTQKISWNEFNRFPYHSFVWCGIDSESEVLCHFPPEDGYNSYLRPKDLHDAENNFDESVAMPEFLSIFGAGDGGGGPKPEHIETGLRVQNLEGCPRLEFGRASDFFPCLDRCRSKLPRWVGELYLEYHRGTLTSQARGKRFNRKGEQLLAVCEFIASCLPAGEYPARQLDRLWKQLLTFQFHDILPGTSIREVHAFVEERYREMMDELNTLIAAAAAVLFHKDESAMMVLNTLSFSYGNTVRLPDSWRACRVFAADGNELPSETIDGETWIKWNFPPQSFTLLRRGETVPTVSISTDSTPVLENALVRYEFNSCAALLSAYDKTTRRELIRKNDGPGNSLALYVDKPRMFNAWEVDLSYEGQTPKYPVNTAPCKATRGTLRQILDFELSVRAMTIRQKVVLEAGSKRLDFITVVESHAKNRMLRTSFPTTIVTQEVSCDIQYGFIKRSTHRNTSWDLAHFEFAAHKYVDLSDSLGGVALLNDCKYGYKALNGTLELNLLRSPTDPDPEADQGMHHFTYSFLPHEGRLAESDVMAEACCLNREVLLLPDVCGKVELPAGIVSEDGVSLEVVKKAEKSNDIVIRLVEMKGKKSSALLRIADGVNLVETDLLEWKDGNLLAVNNSLVRVNLNSFEIKTFRIKKPRSAAVGKD